MLIFHNCIFFVFLKDNKAVGVMKAGNSFTIEPMISEGSWKDEQWVSQFFILYNND